jgi:hypothetical protein
MANYILLESIELTQNAASITFDNLPTSGYTDLKIQYSHRTNRSANGDYDLITFNGTSIATARVLWESAGTATAYTDTNVASLTASATTATDAYSNNTMYIPLYRGSNNKVISIDSAVSDYTTSEQGTSISAVAWNNTNPITSITFTPRFGTAYLAGSTFSMYGISSFGTTAVTAPKATGGNIVANDGTYWYHAFLTSGYFVPQTALTANCLVIGGGGASGPDASSGQGAGGGAGGVFYAISQPLTATSYPVTIGAGGAANAPNSGVRGGNGTNSQFGSLTVGLGGGGGGPGNSNLGGATGGSGGGGGGGPTAGTGAASTQSGTGGTGYGNSGGNGVSVNAGGGGGAGASASGSSGGAGLNTWSAWASATNTGISGYYAGGGAGWATGSPGAGNSGSVSGTASAANAPANVGGGGNGYVGAGGSGIIIIRYAMV